LSNDLSIHSSQATKDQFKQAVIAMTTHYRFVHDLFNTWRHWNVMSWCESAVQTCVFLLPSLIHPFGIHRFKIDSVAMDS